MPGQFGSIRGDQRSFPLDARIFVFGSNKYCDVVVPNARSHEAKIVIDKENKVWLSRFGQDGDIPLLDECTFKVGTEKFTFSSSRPSKTPVHGRTPIFTGDTPTNVLFEETDAPTHGFGEVDFEGPDTIDVRKALSFEPTNTMMGFNLLDEVSLGLGLPSPTIPRTLHRRRSSRGFPHSSSIEEHPLRNEPTSTRVTFALDRQPLYDVSNQLRQDPAVFPKPDRSPKAPIEVTTKKSDLSFSRCLSEVPAQPPASPLQAARDARKLATSRDDGALGLKMSQISQMQDRLGLLPVAALLPQTHSTRASIERKPQTMHYQCFFHPSCQSPPNPCSAQPAPAPAPTAPAPAPTTTATGAPHAAQAYPVGAEEEREPSQTAVPTPTIPATSTAAARFASDHGDAPPPAKKAAAHRVVPPPPAGPRPPTKAFSAPTPHLPRPPSLARPSSVPEPQKGDAKRARAVEAREVPSKRQRTDRPPQTVAEVSQAQPQRSRSLRIQDLQRARVAQAAAREEQRAQQQAALATKRQTAAKQKQGREPARGKSEAKPPVKEVTTVRPPRAPRLQPQAKPNAAGKDLKEAQPAAPSRPKQGVRDAASQKRSRSEALLDSGRSSSEDAQKRCRVDPAAKFEVTALLHTNKLKSLRRPELCALHARLGLVAKSNHTKTQLIQDMVYRLQA